MKMLRIKKGMALPLAGMPQQQIAPTVPVSHVAWTPPAYTPIEAASVVQIDQHVRAGDELFIDNIAPLIKHVAPASGQISEIVYDQVKRLSRIVITVDESPSKPLTPCEKPYAAQSVRDLLMESGLWAQLRQRPFDCVPAVDSQPTHIIVTAMDTRPLAPEPHRVITDQQHDFDTGLEALATQTDGTVFLCQAPGDVLTSASLKNVETVGFNGIHPAGMPSLHIQELCKPTMTLPIWHVDYQDVIALGSVLLQGHVNTLRTISLCGDLALHPRLVRTTMGANVAALLKDEIRGNTNDIKPIVGSYLSGRTKEWLGRFDRQITVMKKPYVASASMTEGQNRAAKGFVAEPIFERINAMNILPTPLLRALVAGDIDLAEKLGCLALCPEDLDIFSYVCPQGNNYADLLNTCNQSLLDKYTVSAGSNLDAA